MSTRDSALADLRSARRALQQLSYQSSAARTALNNALAVVESCRSELDAVVTRHDALLADIHVQQDVFTRRALRSFSDELIRTVLVEVVARVRPPDDSTEHTGYALETACAPFDIASVCRKWRGVALASPKLWTYIGVPVIANPLRGRAYHLYVKTVLDRSTQEHLEIVLDWSSPDTAWTASGYYSRILELLGQHARRWQRIDISFPIGTLPQHVEIFRLSTPVLERALVSRHVCEDEDNTDERRVPWITSPLGYFPLCPALRTFYTNCLPLKISEPLRHLKTLSISDIPLRLVWDMLRRTPDLVTFSISFPYDEWQFPEPPDPRIELRALASLRIAGYEQPLLACLEGVHLPSLTRLVLLACFDEPLDFFVDRITSLCIDKDESGDPLSANVPPGLQDFIHLRDLTVRSCVDGSFFRAAPSPTVSWPELSSITLDGPTLDNETACDFADFARTRCAESATPFLVHITARTEMPPWLASEIRSIAPDTCTIEIDSSGSVDGDSSESDLDSSEGESKDEDEGSTSEYSSWPGVEEDAE